MSRTYILHIQEDTALYVAELLLKAVMTLPLKDRPAALMVAHEYTQACARFVELDEALTEDSE